MSEWIGEDRFHVVKPLSVADCRRLAASPTLETIQFNDYHPREAVWERLNDIVFRRRKDVTLRVYGYGGAWSDIGFLRRLPELERFRWEDDHGSVEPLHHLRRLTALAMGYRSRSKTSLSFLRDFASTLREFTIQGDYRDLPALASLKRLRKLWLASTKVDNFDFLADLPIATLGCYGSRVRHFDSARVFRSTLSWLWIKYNVRLTDVDFLRDLDKLKKLDLHALTKIQSMPDLSRLKCLRKVWIYDCKRLANISGLLKVRKCRISAYGPNFPGRSIQITNP